MDLIFADASPVEYGIWVICFGMFIGVWGKIAAITDRFASRREFDALEHRTERLEAKIQSVELAQVTSQLTVTDEARQEKHLKLIKELSDAIAIRLERNQ